MNLSRFLITVVATATVAVGVTACGGSDTSSSASTDAGAAVSGSIAIDGSSTVFPFAQAAAEEFQTKNPDAKVTVGESGTGGGFEKFCNGEIQIADASRSIKDEEIALCKKGSIKYSEVQIANDGIAIVTNKDLKITCMTTDQLKALWNKTSTVSNYKQLDPSFPDVKVSLFGPGTDSGTFDFFTDEINGEKGDTRKDYQPTEDDNVTVQGVSGEKGGLGYFGLSYYADNTDKLNLVAVNDGSGCVVPSDATVQDGSYKPLSRPLFMYINEADFTPAVKAFMGYVVDNADAIAKNAKIVAMTPAQQTEAKAALSKAEAGASGATTTTG